MKYNKIEDFEIEIFNTDKEKYEVLKEIRVKYYHVYEKLVLLWGSEEIVTYLKNILLQDRDQFRKGFNLKIFGCLVDIKMLHDDNTQLEFTF